MQPLLQWKGNKYFIFWVCVCSLSYPACNAHVPYCYLWPSGCTIFFHYLINDTIKKKGKKEKEKERKRKERKKEKISLLNTKYVFWFSLQLLSGTFLITRRTERDMITNVYWPSCTVPVILVRFFDNYSNTKFHENPSSGSRVVPCGQTDGRTDTTKLIDAFHNFSNSPKNQTLSTA